MAADGAPAFPPGQREGLKPGCLGFFLLPPGGFLRCEGAGERDECVLALVCCCAGALCLPICVFLLMFAVWRPQKRSCRLARPADAPHMKKCTPGAKVCVSARGARHALARSESILVAIGTGAPVGWRANAQQKVPLALSVAHC